MKILSAAFVKGIIGTDDILYNGKDQIAFMGRSNVGKSTLINNLVGRKNLARSSSAPGKTVRMDFFLVNNKFYFVDFPGYGYARASGKKRDKLRKMILWYLFFSEVKKRLVVLIIDAKVGLTDFDRDVLGILTREKIKHLILVNKIDNVEYNLRDRKFEEVSRLYPGTEVISYSSEEDIGRDKLMNSLNQFLSG